MPKSLILIITLLLFCIAVLGLCFTYQISTVPNFENEQEFVIKKGESLENIGQNLLNENIITSKLAFETYIRIKKLSGSIQAGTYVLTPMNIRDLTEILIAGKVDNEISLRFIEGWTITEIGDYLVKDKIISQPNEFINLAKIDNFRFDYDVLKDPNIKSLEGFLFPDTYQVYKDTDIQKIIQKMITNFSEKVTPAMLTEIKAQNKTLYDVLKIASIIEMEVPTDADRQIVSGILWKRLSVDMPLQVDSTLKYEIGKQNRNALTFEELEIDSPFNTYKYTGLPPTPICNPGESAIRAAIYPKNSDYWFYLSDKTGQTIFSATAEDHAAAVEKYLK